MVKIILDYAIHLVEPLHPELKRCLRKELIWPNPLHFEYQAKGYPVWGIPKFIQCFTREGMNDWRAPRGARSIIEKICSDLGLELAFEDKRSSILIEVKSAIVLRPSQAWTTAQLLEKDEVVLIAPPGFGKTVVACDLIARRGECTLVLVHTKTLLGQWKKALKKHLKLTAKEIGVVGDQKKSWSNKVTVAMIQTLHRMAPAEFQNRFGHLIVDECHHVPAATFTKLVQQINVRYILGLTATPRRRDHLEKLMFLSLGEGFDVRTLRLSTEKATIVPRIIVRPTPFVSTSKWASQALWHQIINSRERNGMILKDIVTEFRAKRSVLVIVERKEHGNLLATQLRLRMVPHAVVYGDTKRDDRELLIKKFIAKKVQVLIATGQLLGEGFDMPALDSVVLAFPMASHRKLVQYIGRVSRSATGKSEARLYDYLDRDVPILQRWFDKRATIYRKMDRNFKDSVDDAVSKQATLF